MSQFDSINTISFYQGSPTATAVQITNTRFIDLQKCFDKNVTDHSILIKTLQMYGFIVA